MCVDSLGGFCLYETFVYAIKKETGKSASFSFLRWSFYAFPTLPKTFIL